MHWWYSSTMNHTALQFRAHQGSIMCLHMHKPANQVPSQRRAWIPWSTKWKTPANFDPLTDNENYKIESLSVIFFENHAICCFWGQLLSFALSSCAADCNTMFQTKWQYSYSVPSKKCIIAKLKPHIAISQPPQHNSAWYLWFGLVWCNWTICGKNICHVFWCIGLLTLHP